MNTTTPQCESICDHIKGHSGEVVRVRVSKPKQPVFHFNYCQAAIDHDRENGYEVKVIAEPVTEQA